MKIFFTILYCCLLSYSLFAQEESITIDLKKETSLEDFINLLETEHGLLFSYMEQDVQGILLEKQSTSLPVPDLLTKVLQSTGLQYKIINENYIVLTKKQILDEEDWLTFCGQIKDGLTQSPLAYANVFFLKSKKGTVTETDGYFQIESPLIAGDSLVFSYVGYEEKRFLAKAFIIEPCKEVALSLRDFGEDLVVVTEYLTEGVELNNKDLSTQLRPNKSGLLPGQAEPDVLETLQFLPGITSTDATASNLSIRGGRPDQNLILWEDIPIYHAAHYFGTISAFNPYIIDKVSVYRGGFDAGYGGRVSGVIDLKSEDLSDEGSDFVVGANMLNFYTNGHLSLANNKLKIIYSARRSFAELWRSPTYESLTKRIQQGVLVQDVDLDNLPPGIRINDDFTFLDSNIKLAYQLSEKDDLSVAAFYGYNDFKAEIFDDNFKQRQTDTLYLDNQGVSLAWNHRWNDQFSLRLLGVHSAYKYNYEYRLQTESQNQPPMPSSTVIDRSGLKESKVEEQQIHLTGKYITARTRELGIGYHLVQYDTDYSLFSIRERGREREEGQQAKAKLHTLYSTFKTPSKGRYGFDAGVRLNYFDANNNVIVEPRLRLWYNYSKHLSFHVNGGRYVQYLNQLYEIAGDDSSIRTPVWALAEGKESKVLDALQFQAGLIFQKKTWLLDLQTYVKRVEGQTSLSSEFGDDLASQFHSGSSNVRGVDVLLKKRWGGFRTWVSYALSQNTYEFPTFFDPSFSAPNDQRHVFNLSNSYVLSQWSFSLGWKISSGRPYSLLEDYVLQFSADMDGPKEFIVPVTNEYNSGTLRATHQLDAAVRYSILPRNSSNWKGVIGLSLLNIYDQRNVYSRTFSIRTKPNDQSVLEYTDNISLGFTPNLVFRLEW